MSLGDVRQGLIYRNLKRRRAAQDRRAFNALVAAPFDLGSAAAGDALPNTFNLPARSRLAVSVSEDVESGDVVVSIGARNHPVPDLAADVLHRIPLGERAEVVTVSSDVGAPAADVTLYVLDEWSVSAEIANGSIS